MFTLSDARRAIGRSAIFARAGVDVQSGCVRGVEMVEEENDLVRYSGVVHSAARCEYPSFLYDQELKDFVYCECTCEQCGGSAWGCRHVAALMIAVCRSAVKTETDDDALIEMLLFNRRPPRPQGAQPPVRLYPMLRRVSLTEVALGLRIGRTRAYVVRSMKELASRAERGESAVYGRELTFSHSVEELDARDVALYGQVVMMAAEGMAAVGAELMLSGAALDQMMRLLMGHEVTVRDARGASHTAVVAQGELSLPLELSQEDGRAALCVRTEGVVLGQAGAYRLGEKAVVCAYGEAFSRVADLLELARFCPQGARFDAKRLPEVCARLIRPAGTCAVMRAGQALLASHLPTPVVPKFYVDAEDAGRLTCRVAFDYCGTELADDQPAPHIRRDTVLEEAAHAAAQALFPERTDGGAYAFAGDDDACYALLSERLPALERTGEVHVSRRLAQMNVRQTRSMTFGLSVQGEKLILLADLCGYTQEELEQALTAYREKRAYVRLKDGTFLSDAALRQAADAAQVLDSLDLCAEEAQQGAELPMSRAMYLDAALKNRESLSLRAPKAIEAWTERMKAAQQTRAKQPAGLRTTLRGYQLEGLSWLCALSDAGFCGILADDMGLGKTVQALAMLLREREQGRHVRALVVCPASLQLNWLAEAQRFAPELTVCSLSGTGSERAQQVDGEENLLVTSYDQLRRDVRLYEQCAFTHVLLDEAQNIKNAASQTAKAVKALRAQHRFAMTGTPIENRLSELWSIFDFLMPGYLGTYKRFRDRFEAPVVREADERARENLHLLVAPFILRRMKRDVLEDLPEKVETVMNSEMTAEQRRLYTAYAAQLQRESAGGLSDGQARMKLLAGLTRLRQLCCDPRLCMEGYQGGSGKLAQLLEIVRDALASGHRLLLFSQFTSMLALIAEALDGEGIAYFMLTGDTDKVVRMERVRRFNEGEADVFLVSLKAGGSGLNLTGADVVIHYDPWWNVAAQNQATDRAYRIGQTKGVQVIRLIASGTVEEHMLRLQARKQALGDGVLLGEESFFTMDAELLREVLGG